jgi:hypothetical protein
VKYFSFGVLTHRGLVLQFQRSAEKPPFDRADIRQELFSRLSQIDDVDLPRDFLRRRPSFPLSVLAKPEAMKHFKKTIEWALQEVKAGAVAS